MATEAEILAAIDAAIIDILQNGQEVEVDGQRYTKASLDKLFDRRAQITALSNTVSSGGIFDRMKTGVPYRG